ncbi:helix-turn-helix domain-containing protein [Streptomyces sp. NBC_00190]|uniref:AraC-like ligand-binding domain-containing protein n=1 Tax=Streptomyces sp. NBC_00190 TaxID=2903634 RepID=UPI002E2C877D|nr:helix-turn-helix domain-containing protein [Streptomyces sp. NBC_00190]
MWAKLSADMVAPKERFDWYNDVVASSLVPVSLTSDQSADFRCEASVLDLGAAQVSAHTYGQLRSRRTSALIRRSDPEQFQLGLMVRGGMWMSQHGGGDALVGPGDMILWDTSKQWEAATRAGDATMEAVILQMPRDALPLRAGRVDGLFGRRIGGESGMGAVLARFMSSLRPHGAECAPQELRGLGSVAVDLAAAVLAQRVDAYGELPAEARACALRERIDAFIEHNLGDPALTPGLIAAAHGISVRALHLLFRDQPQSVAATVRHRRLERCRSDLARPELAARSVRDIAARWCFSSAPVFGRSFREAYGTSPGAFRREAARAPGR